MSSPSMATFLFCGPSSGSSLTLPSDFSAFSSVSIDTEVSRLMPLDPAGAEALPSTAGSSVGVFLKASFDC